MDSRTSERTLELINASPGAREALEHVEAMSDAELRALVADEHPMVVKAADAIITRRHAAVRSAS